MIEKLRKWLKGFFCGISFGIGLILSFLLGFSKILKFILMPISQLQFNISWIASIFTFSLNSAFLSDLATFQGVLIGVAIPIALQVVTRTADRYRDQEIAQFFIKEPLYRSQYFLFLSNIAITILLRFLNISSLPTLLLIFLWFLLNICIFYRFIRLVEQYATNTDRLLLGKLKRHVETILKK